ncbi:MAG: FAD:protein FMN transferase [Oscillospiraceae bacterium]|jgi:thiamine biosynthesis lipoprotein|nr:FAD:protein FMN transferase [Oscillospiraceae bacterium]
MDTIMNITAYGKDAEAAVRDAERLINHFDALWSVGKPESEISRINNGDTPALNTATDDILRQAELLREMTDGAFDERVFTLVDAWGFYSGDYRVPGGDEIAALLTSKDKIDLGGIAKGYASDKAAELLRSEGVKSAIINLGGNVYALGSRPGGAAWRVAVRDPFDGAKYIGSLELRDLAAVTSGGYERYFEENGVRYHHIMDPRTGYPADSGLASVTVVSENGTLADGLSTGLFVLGKERAVELWRENKGLFELVLVENDGTVTITDGLKNSFSSDAPASVAGAGVIGVFKDGELLHAVDLDAVSEPYDFVAGDDNIVRIAPGEAFMLSAGCRDQICVRHAGLRSGGSYGLAGPVVCLPNKVVIKYIDELPS